MGVSYPVYPVIIGNVRGARQMLPGQDWKAEDQRGVQARTSGGNNNNNDDKSGNMPSWMFKEELKQITWKKGDSIKKPAKTNDDHARYQRISKSKREADTRRVIQYTH